MDNVVSTNGNIVVVNSMIVGVVVVVVVDGEGVVVGFVGYYLCCIR
jgi:hypothetical protein